MIILQLKNARDIDATSCLALQQLNDYLKSSGRHLIACGITPALWEVLCDSGIVESLGKENLFIFDERQPHQYMLKALERAYILSASTHVIAQEKQEPEPIVELLDSTQIENN